MLESSSIGNEKQMYIKEYKGKSPESIVIPEKANDQNGTERKVTGIRAKAFANNKNLKTIKFRAVSFILKATFSKAATIWKRLY